MVAFRTLGPQDPIPDGAGVTLMRRLAEDSPQGTVIELIVRHADGREETANPIAPDGTPLAWSDAAALARDRARQAGLDEVVCIDRTAGPLASEILRHGGDHALDRNKLEDSDLEEGERGSDLRDRGPDGGPRRF
jgi:hypothetical protein